MRVALVHDWLTGMRGGEKVLEAICEIYPDADVFTLVHVPGSVSGCIERHRIETSFIDRLPFAWKRHQVYLPLFPSAIESFDLDGYDLVVSSSHCVAKGVITRPDVPHICYCHTPMRYAWDFHGDYQEAARQRWFAGPVFTLSLNYLRMWDVCSARRPDFYIANSSHVKKRIGRYYGRNAEVVHPPVDEDFFTPSSDDSGDYWLMVSALVPYKGVELAVKAFNESRRELVIVGDGSERHRLESIAGDNVHFRGWVEPGQLLRHYRECRGLVFPGEEDFGITPLEANACGRPVVALARGGALETQVEGETAVFFSEPEPGALLDAVARAETIRWNREAIRARACSFGRNRFKKELSDCIERLLASRAGETA